MSRQRKGFERVKAVQEFNAKQAARHKELITPEDLGWKQDDFKLYWLDGVTDVHLEKWPGYGFKLVYHENNFFNLVPAGLLKTMTEAIKEENDIGT